MGGGEHGQSRGVGLGVLGGGRPRGCRCGQAPGAEGSGRAQHPSPPQPPQRLTPRRSQSNATLRRELDSLRQQGEAHAAQAAESERLRTALASAERTAREQAEAAEATAAGLRAELAASAFAAQQAIDEASRLAVAVDEAEERGREALSEERQLTTQRTQAAMEQESAASRQAVRSPTSDDPCLL